MDGLIIQIENLRNLPAFPQALSQLITLLGDEQREMEDVTRIISSDRALSLAVLRVANSAALGAAVRITSLADAVPRLGGAHLMKIAISQMSEQILAKAGRGYGLEGQDAWEGALAGAIAAEILAKRLHFDPALAFTGGLLRDCGKLAMDALYGTERMRQVFVAKDADEDQLQIEQLAFGCDHAEVGALLVQHWGLAQEIASAARWHHAPSSAVHTELIDIVYVGDIIAVQLGYGVGLDGLSYRMDPAALARLGIDLPHFMELMVEASVAQMKFLGDLQLMAGPNQED